MHFVENSPNTFWVDTFNCCLLKLRYETSHQSMGLNAGLVKPNLFWSSFVSLLNTFCKRWYDIICFLWHLPCRFLTWIKFILTLPNGSIHFNFFCVYPILYTINYEPYTYMGLVCIGQSSPLHRGELKWKPLALFTLLFGTSISFELTYSCCTQTEITNAGSEDTFCGLLHTHAPYFILC